MKGPPSATGSHQACDRASTFRELKRRIKNQCQKGEISGPKRLTLLNNLNQSFDSLQSLFPSITVTREFKDKVIRGCEIFVDTTKNDCLSDHTIRTGFTICGHHRDISDDLILPSQNCNFGLEYSTVDFDKIMSQCYTKIPKEEQGKMKAALPQLVKIMRENGRITDIEMDNLNIMKLPEEYHIDRDNFVLWRQHAQLITHDVRLEYFKDYLEERCKRTDKDQIELGKRKRELEKEIQAFENAANKKRLQEETKKTKAEQKDQEKLRMNSISKEIREAEILERKNREKIQKNLKKQSLEAAEKSKAEQYQQNLLTLAELNIL